MATPTVWTDLRDHCRSFSTVLGKLMLPYGVGETRPPNQIQIGRVHDFVFQLTTASAQGRKVHPQWFVVDLDHVRMCSVTRAHRLPLTPFPPPLSLSSRCE